MIALDDSTPVGILEAIVVHDSSSHEQLGYQLLTGPGSNNPLKTRTDDESLKIFVYFPTHSGQCVIGLESSSSFENLSPYLDQIADEDKHARLA